MSQDPEENKEDGIVPRDAGMKAGFEEILKADKYIIITLKEENGGISSTIRHETDFIETFEELEYWSKVFRARAKHQSNLSDILRENGIGD